MRKVEHLCFNMSDILLFLLTQDTNTSTFKKSSSLNKRLSEMSFIKVTFKVFWAITFDTLFCTHSSNFCHLQIKCLPRQIITCSINSLDLGLCLLMQETF